MDRAVGHLHAAEPLAVAFGPGRHIETERSAAPAGPEPQFGIDRQAHLVGHPFAEEHREDLCAALDEQVADAAFLEVGDDLCCRM